MVIKLVVVVVDKIIKSFAYKRELSFMPFGKTNGSDRLLSHEKVCGSVIRDLTQKDGWKTQDGRMTKKCRARPGMHSLALHFFVILPSCVFQPSCCVKSLTATRGHVEHLIGHFRVPLSLSFKTRLSARFLLW